MAYFTKIDETKLINKKNQVQKKKKQKLNFKVTFICI